MKKYSALTKYINFLENDNVGEWIVDKENDDSSERPIHVPFVSYSITVKKLADDIFKFAKESDEIVPSILALLIASLRAERFCDGALLEFIKSGAVTRWLKRLQELDEA